MQLTKRDGQEQQGWRRVDRANPCPVCHKSDWCLVARDGSATICPRTAEGAVQRCGDAGWLHRHRDREDRRPPRPGRITIRLGGPAAPRPGMADLAERFRAAVDPGRLDWLARGLGLSVEGLRRLGIGWCDPSRAWSFPMTDAAGRVVGIRLRTDLGKKFAVSGSKEGLFLASDFDGTGLVLIGEGPTDTTAMLDLGFQAVGRPSCRGGAPQLTALVRRHRPREVVILADRDQPGQDGALALVSRLVVHVPRLRVVAPPPGCKDIRDWKQAGATPNDLQEAIRTALVHRVSVRVPATARTKEGRSS